MLRTIRFTWLGVVALVLVSGFAVCQEPSSQDIERLTENWRWSHYWFGKTGIDDVYTPGKKINALIFWTRKDRRPKTGLCSSDLSICVAYSGRYLSPQAERMQIGAKTSLQQAFASFVSSGFGGGEEYFDPKEQLRLGD